MNNPYVYWVRQCDVCINRRYCEERLDAIKYIADLRKVNDRETFGNLSWWCDYFKLDREEYNKQNLGETNGRN